MTSFSVKNTTIPSIESLIASFAVNNIYNANKLQGININSDTDTVQDSSILVYDSTNSQWTYDILSTSTTDSQSINNLSYLLQQQKIQSSDIEGGDYFGWSVSINSTGDYAIIGAYGEDTAGSNAGAAYIFTRSGSTWTQQQRIVGSDIGAGDYFGHSVAINSTGDYAIVGANAEESTNVGAAYIFTRSGTVWTEQQKIVGIGSSDYFGTSVAINSIGDYAVVGAPGDPTSETGDAYIFTRSGTTWTQQQQLQSSDKQIGDNFGVSVSINSIGDYVVVGANLEDTGGISAGSAYIFTRSGSTWTQQQKIQSSDKQSGDAFGTSVSINSIGDYVVVGAPTEDTGGDGAGAAYIFTRSDTTWTQQQKIQSSDKQAGDNFGTSVSINSIGDYIVVGAHLEDTGGSNAGAAYIFTRSGSTWTQQQKIVSSDIEADDFFGYSVSSNGTGEYVIVGANREDTYSGAVYIFKNDIQLNKIQNEYVDSTTNEEISLSGINNILIKTAKPVTDPVDGPYIITLANDLVSGKEVILINGSNDSFKVTFVPAVIGWSNDDTLLASEGKIKIVYISATNTWYNIS